MSNITNLLVSLITHTQMIRLLYQIVRMKKNGKTHIRRKKKDTKCGNTTDVFKK